MAADRDHKDAASSLMRIVRNGYNPKRIIMTPPHVPLTDFAGVYDTLANDLIDSAFDPRTPRRFAACWLGTTSVQDIGQQWDSAERPKRYLEHESSPLDAKQLTPDSDEIAAELGLNLSITGDDIARLRREFALRNHPDRVPQELRAVATQRMQIANALLDALARAIATAQAGR